MDESANGGAHSGRRAIVVVGAGFGGLRFFIDSLNLVIENHLSDFVEYVFIDQRPFESFGRGVAWASDQNPNMRANMHRPELEIDPETQDEVDNILKFPADHQPTSAELFSRRKEVGDRLAAKFTECIDRATEHHVPFRPLKDEAIDIVRAGIQYDVTLRSGGRIRADCVVLALGHVPPTGWAKLFDCPNYTRNAWALGQDAIDAIPRTARVAVIGLGPSGVDAIIKLRDGGVRKVAGYSRSGAMQYPRPNPTKIAAKIITEDNIQKLATAQPALRVDTLLGLLAAEFMAQDIDWCPFLRAVEISNGPAKKCLSDGYDEGHGQKTSDWFGLITTFNAVIPIAWHLLDDRDRQRFRELKDSVDNVLYGMAPPHALRMLTELEHGTLKLFGGLRDILHDDVSGVFSVIRAVDGNPVTDEVDYVIDCTGFGKDLANSRTPLLENMLTSGMLTAHEFGGAVVDFTTGQVPKDAKGRSVHIYALSGTLNIGTRLATNGLSEVAGSARRTAQAVHRQLFPA